jgi:predicted outer membrane repeat protein
MNQTRRIPFLLAAVAVGLSLVGLTLRASAAPAQGAMFTYPGAFPCNTTLQACIDGAGSGDLITILPNTYVTSVVLNKAVSLIGADLNTTILRAPTGQRALRITGAAVMAATVVSSLTVQGDFLATENGAGILVDDGAQPTLQNLTIQSGTVTAPSAVGGGLFTLSSLTLTNVTFFQNVAFAGHGGGLGGGPGARLKLVNVTFNGNGADQGGGGMYAESASISESAFISNVAGFSGHGGAAYITGTVAVINTTFIQNQTHESGGGLFVGGDARIGGGEFRSNTSLDENGGALEVGGDLHLSGTIITGNQSFDSGGAIFVTGTTTINNSLVANNLTTGGAGGGLRAIGTVNISNSQFISNTSHNQGGAVRVNGAIFLTGTTFMSNTSGVGAGIGEGGGLRASATANIVGGSFVANNAEQGGGAYIQGNLLLSGTTFSGNTAAEEGGGLKVFTATVQNAAFDHNQVLFGNGGGLAAANILAITDSRFTANSVLSGTQAAGNGSGGGVFGDGVVLSNDNVFFANFAQRLGGGMDADDLQSTGDKFRGNLTGPQGSGGGLFVAGDFDVAAGLFITNTANSGGGLGVNSNAEGSIVNSLFARNVVTFTDGGAALRLLSTTSVTVTHNTFVGTNAAGRAAVHMQSTPGDFFFFANIFSHFAQGLKQFGTPPTSTVTTAHTVFFSVTVPYIGPISHGVSDITGTVLYRNAADDDYHLLPGSVAIDYAPSYGLDTDFDGQIRPIGVNFDVGFDEVAYYLFLPLLMR